MQLITHLRERYDYETQALTAQLNTSRLLVDELITVLEGMADRLTGREWTAEDLELVAEDLRRVGFRIDGPGDA